MTEQKRTEAEAIDAARAWARVTELTKQLAQVRSELRQETTHGAEMWEMWETTATLIRQLTHGVERATDVIRDLQADLAAARVAQVNRAATTDKPEDVAYWRAEAAGQKFRAERLTRELAELNERYAQYAQYVQREQENAQCGGEP